MPLHYSPVLHWGLICVDLEKSFVRFDDRMAVNPPKNLCYLRTVPPNTDVFFAKAMTMEKN